MSFHQDNILIPPPKAGKEPKTATDTEENEIHWKPLKCPVRRVCGNGRWYDEKIKRVI